jgi:hypothetical protein
MVKEVLRIWFDDEANIWHWKGPEDKIIVVYPSNISENDEIKLVETTSFDFGRTDHIGHIKMYCNGNNIKVYDFKFNTSQQAIEAFKIFKKYCILTIKNLNLRGDHIDLCGFYIHWDLPGATDFLRSISFINVDNNIYKFSGKEVLSLTDTEGLWAPNFQSSIAIPTQTPTQIPTQIPTQTANLPFSAFTSQQTPQQNSTIPTFGIPSAQQTPQTSLFNPQTRQDQQSAFKRFESSQKKDSIFESSLSETSKKSDVFGSTQVSNPFGGTSNQGYNFNTGVKQQSNPFGGTSNQGYNFNVGAKQTRSTTPWTFGPK